MQEIDNAQEIDTVRESVLSEWIVEYSPMILRTAYTGSLFFLQRIPMQ